MDEMRKITFNNMLFLSNSNVFPKPMAKLYCLRIFVILSELSITASNGDVIYDNNILVELFKMSNTKISFFAEIIFSSSPPQFIYLHV